ncbi:MAG: HAMP domain-containing protein, partial [Xenococcaceae cyanobacterium MO_188.B29]|nr:HAMP domain-containing protein [Xenococcaceae cyanobacterium MO_188.B29]
MKLKSKILLGYGFVLGLMVLVGCWGTFNLRRLGKASNAILQENYRSILAAENIIDALERQDSAVLLFILNDKDQAEKQFLQGEIQFLQWLARAKDNITISEEKDILNALESNYNSYLKSVDSPNINIDKYYNNIFPLFMEIRNLSIQLREVNQETMVSASNSAQRVSQQAIWSMAIALGSAASLGLIFSLLLANRITQPLTKTISATEKIAEGNYNIAVEVASQDELGILATEINNMSQKLKAFHELNVGKVIIEQQRNEAIIQSIGDGIIVVDEQLKIIALNPNAASLVSIKPQLAVNNYFLDVFENKELAGYLKETILT